VAVDPLMLQRMVIGVVDATFVLGYSWSGSMGIGKQQTLPEYIEFTIYWIGD